MPLRILWPIAEVRLTTIGACYGRSRIEMERRARLLGLWDARPHGRIPVYSVSEFRRLWLDPAETKVSMAKRFGMTKNQVLKHAHALGLPPRKPGRQPTYAFGEAFAEMWRAGVLSREIARHFGCSPTLVSKEAQRQGLPPRGKWSADALTLADFPQWKLRQAMAVAAAEEQAAFRKAGMLAGTVATRGAA